jgi:hypothetical protein
MLDRARLAFCDQLRACAHSILKRLFWHEGVNEPAAEGFRRALQSIQRNATTHFRLFKLYDAGLRHAKSVRKLRRGHAKRIANSPQPTLWGAGAIG